MERYAHGSEGRQTILESASQHIHHVIPRIQYFHECGTAAKERDARKDVAGVFDDPTETDDVVISEAEDEHGTIEVMEEEMAELLASQVPNRERQYAERAIAAAQQAGFFYDEIHSWIIHPHKRARNAGADICRIKNWDAQMLEDIQQQNGRTPFETGPILLVGYPDDAATTRGIRERNRPDAAQARLIKIA
jgi:hypothetical protein